MSLQEATNAVQDARKMLTRVLELEAEVEEVCEAIAELDLTKTQLAAIGIAFHDMVDHVRQSQHQLYEKVQRQ